MRIVFCLLFVAVLAQCGSDIPHQKISSIEFQSPSLSDVERINKDELDLIVNIFPVDKDVVLLFGGLYGDAGEFSAWQSSLLRSVDGGGHWREVMKPVARSYIRDLLILQSGVGWALLHEPIYEYAPDSYTLYLTNDFGANWEEISVIPLSSEKFPIELQMILIDEQHGHMDMLYEDGYLEFLATKDGGVNWESTSIYKPKFREQYRNRIVLDSYKGLIKYNLDKSQSSALTNDSWWALDGRYGDPDSKTIVIQRSVYGEVNEALQTTFLVPKNYIYQDGLIVTP